MMHIKLFGPAMTRTSTADLATALAHLERGDWRAAHEIVQRGEEDALAFKALRAALAPRSA